MFWEIDRGGGATNNTKVDSCVEELVRSQLFPLTASDCDCMSSPGQDSSSSRRKSRARPVQPLIDPDSLTAFHAKRLALGTPTLIDRLIFRNKSALFEEMETKKRGPGRPPSTLKTNVLKRKRTKSTAGATADSPTLKRLRSRKEAGSESDSSMDSRNHSLERKSPRAVNSTNKPSPQGKNKPSKKLRKGKKSRCSERILNSHLRSGKKRNELHSKQQRRKRSLSDNSSTKERKDSNFNLKDNNFNSNVSEEQNEDTVGDSTDSEVSRNNTKLVKKPISVKKEHILLEEEGKRKRRRRKKRDSMWVMKVKKKFNTKRDNVKEEKTFPISAPPPSLLTEETPPKEDSTFDLPGKLLPDLPVLDKVNIEDFTGNVKDELTIKIEELDVDMPKLEKQVEVEFATKKETETISVQPEIDKGINISILTVDENEPSKVVMDEPSVGLEQLTKPRETIYNESIEAINEETEVGGQNTVPTKKEAVSNLPPEETVVSESQKLVTTEVSEAMIVDENKETMADIKQITHLDTANHLKRDEALSHLVSLVVQDLEDTTNLNKEIKDPVDTDNKTESVINQVFESKGPISEKRQEEDEPLPVADSTSELNQSLDDSFNEFTLSLPDDLELGSPEHPGHGEDMDTSMFPDSTDTSHAEVDRNKEEDEEEDIQDDCNQITSHSEVQEKEDTREMDTVKENGLENEDLRPIEDKEKSSPTIRLDEGEVGNSSELGEELETESPKGTEKGNSCEVVVKMLEAEESMLTLEGKKEKVEDETLRAQCEELIVGEVKSSREEQKSEEHQKKASSVVKKECSVDVSEEASKCDIENVLNDLNSQKSTEKDRMKKEELSLEQRQLKESVLQALGLKCSAGTSRVSPPVEKPKIDGYTGTLKAVIKLNRNRDKNKITSGSSEDSMIGELEYRICSEIPTSETVPINRPNDKNHQSNETSTSHNGSLSNNGLHSSDEHLDHNQPSSSSVGKDLIIPEKSSSFSIHPGRLCSDVCSYCFGKFGSLDTPCHIGQLKADRQKKILESKFLEETHLTVESCLCDACFRYIDRKANSPPTKPGAPRGGSRVKSSVCCVSNCTEEATHTVRKKWLVKMKKSIANKLDIDFNKSAAMYYFPLCENHHNWVDYFTVCGICRKRLSRNHFFTVGSDSDRLNLMLAVDGIPARLSDKLFICKLCKNYSDIRLQADDLEDLPSSSYLYCREYRKKILQALDHPVSDSDDELVSLASSSGGGATSGGTTSSSREETKGKKKESERIRHSSPGSSPSPESSQDGLLNVPCVGILLRDKASQETTIQMVKVGNASIGGLNTINPSPRSGPQPEERVPYPQEIGLQANMDFQGSAVPDASWERCVSTIQFDKKTKNLWQELQKPYGNQSSFLRHLVHLEKYWRSGYLTLATGADERAAKYLNLVRNRIKAFEGNGGFSTSPKSSSPTVISTSSAGTSTNSFDPMLMNTSEIEVRPIPPIKKPVEKKPQPILTPLDRAKALVRMATPSQRMTPPPQYPSPGSSSIQRFQVPPMYISQGFYQPQTAQNLPPPLLKIRKLVPSTSNPPPPSCTTSFSIIPHQYNQGLQLRKVRPLYGRLPGVTVSQLPTSVTLNKAGITIEKQTGSSCLTPPSLPIEKPSISVFREPAPSPAPNPGFILP